MFVLYFACGASVRLDSLPVGTSLSHSLKNQPIKNQPIKNQPNKKSTKSNINQSKIGIGSGELAGKGFLKGTQGQLEFLPEHHTDFIFSLLAEEFGFIGAMTTLLLYLFLCLRGLAIGARCSHFFGKLTAAGVSFLLFIHVTVNVAMICGLIPVVGAPLPLLSYGGTIVMTMMIGFGLLLNSRVYSDAEIRGYAVKGLYKG